VAVPRPVEVHATATHFLGMPAARFLRDYWQKAPLLVRHAFPGYVAPLAPEDLAGLACEEAALSRLVQHDRSSDAWRVRSGPFDEAEFPALGTRDWTLLVQDMDKWDADVRALLERFRFLPAWRVDDVMASFATPGGSVGAHVDQYDVFLLQAQGQRRWQIDARADAPRGFRDDVELKLLERFAPTHDWVLAPGDMLYLPPGVPHHGEAVDACMTFSIGMRAPAQAELLVDLAETVAATLPEERRYTDPDLAPAVDPWEIGEDAFARVDAIIATMQSLDPAARREWFGRFITRYRSAGDVAAAPGARGWPAVLRALDKGGRLQRHPFARVAWTALPGARGARLFVDGEALAMGRKAARVLAAAETLDAAVLATLDAAGRHAVEQLHGRGYYRLEPAPRTRR
jgi:50S ribosomal protein L16 3-hydroxylase